jgi:RHS repeat-associated protein
VVQQGVQQRNFVYDGLGRLTSATTPEAGTVSYTYTDFSAIATRTDARGVQAVYAYDALHRLTSISYTVPTGVRATPAVNSYYDEGGAAANALGQLTHFTDGVGSESYQYDALGRVTQLNKTIAGITYTIRYQFNAADELTAITYPSGRQVTEQLDAIGRISQIQSGGVNYLSNIAYNAASLPTGGTYGNGVTASYGYNTRLQLSSMVYSNPTQTLFSLAYDYGTGNNGQIQSVTDNVDTTKTTTYTYDAWVRLKTAQNGQWGLSWTYDRYGNRKAQTVTAGTGPSNAVTPSPSTNRLTDPGYTYDAAGNMTSDGLNTLAYDAENRVVSSATGGVTSTYSYDGNGLRVQKVSGSTTTVYIFSGTKVVAEYVNGAAPALPAREYIYAGSQLLAKLEGGASQYYHADHLSVRLMTDVNGNVVGQQGHYPFGESWYQTSTTTKWFFTGYERDTESGNDYAMFRYDANRLGRFASPDPLAGSLANPQSLNRYAYVLNDPVNWDDPLGLCPKGYRRATPQEAQAIVDAARAIAEQNNPPGTIGYAQGAVYDKDGHLLACDCSNYLRIAAEQAGLEIPRATTADIASGSFERDTSVIVGDVLLLSFPGYAPNGHAVLVSKVGRDSTLGLLASGSKGPSSISGADYASRKHAENKFTYQKRVDEAVRNGQVYRPCVKDSPTSRGGGVGGGGAGGQWVFWQPIFCGGSETDGCWFGPSLWIWVVGRSGGVGWILPPNEN